MLFITGDLHGQTDIFKLQAGCFSPKGLTREDYVLICGDFGLLWSGSAREEKWLEWLENKPWTTLWIDGNHENYDMIARYPREAWHGGEVQRIREHILHLCRGGIFELDGRRVFAFGGAESHDKVFRILGETLWEEEMPSEEERETGRRHLEEAGWKVDVVVTHTLPQSLQWELFGQEEYRANELTMYFEELRAKLDYRLWFSGHYHRSLRCDERHYLIYNNIVKLTDDGFERVYPRRPEVETHNWLIDVRR